MNQPLEWRTEQRRVNDLIPLDINPRKITEAKRMKMIESLQKFNLVDIPVVDFDGTVISGHQRLRALQAIGRGDEVIDVRLPNRQLTEKERKEYNVLANTHFGEFDIELYEEHFGEVALDDLGVSRRDVFRDDFKVEEPPVVLEAHEDDYEVPDVIVTDIVSGDFFEIGPHRLLCGDSTNADDVERVMGGEKADLVVTDPPYNVNYKGATGMTIMNDNQSDAKFLQFLKDSFSLNFSYLKPGGSCYIWHSDSEGLNFRSAMVESGIKIRQCLIWVKNSFVMGRQDYQWQHEPCLYGWKEGGAHFFTQFRNRTTVIEDKIDLAKLKKNEMMEMLQRFVYGEDKTTILRADKTIKNDKHPTMKPVVLIADLIQNSSRRQENVLDFFAGSGTTMVASHQVNRRCYMLEISPNYCQVIVDRMLRLDPTLEVKRNGQPYTPKK